MKENFITALLSENKSVAWENGKTMALFTAPKVRQFIEVKLVDFFLEDTETVFIAFHKSDTAQVNKVEMEKVNASLYRTKIPPLVANTQGVWEAQFFIGYGAKNNEGVYEYEEPTAPISFVEYASLADDGYTVPSAEDLNNAFNSLKNASTKVHYGYYNFDEYSSLVRLESANKGDIVIDMQSGILAIIDGYEEEIDYYYFTQIGYLPREKVEIPEQKKYYLHRISIEGTPSWYSLVCISSKSTLFQSLDEAINDKFYLKVTQCVRAGKLAFITNAFNDIGSSYLISGYVDNIAFADTVYFGNGVTFHDSVIGEI